MYTSCFFSPLFPPPLLAGLSFRFLFFCYWQGISSICSSDTNGLLQSIALICLTKSLHVYYYDDFELRAVQDLPPKMYLGGICLLGVF
jgi:hypothetical protein